MEGASPQPAHGETGKLIYSISATNLIGLHKDDQSGKTFFSIDLLFTEQELAKMLLIAQEMEAHKKMPRVYINTEPTPPDIFVWFYLPRLNAELLKVLEKDVFLDIATAPAPHPSRVKLHAIYETEVSIETMGLFWKSYEKTETFRLAFYHEADPQMALWSVWLTVYQSGRPHLV